MCLLWGLASHTTNAEPISTVVTSVEALYYAIHPPLPASKPLLSSWSLVVICPLIAPGVTEITGWYDNRLVVPGTRYQAPLGVYTRAQHHVCTRIWDIYRVPEYHLFATYWYHVYRSTHTYFHTWHQVLLLLLLLFLWRNDQKKSRKQGAKKGKKIFCCYCCGEMVTKK